MSMRTATDLNEGEQVAVLVAAIRRLMNDGGDPIFETVVRNALSVGGISNAGVADYLAPHVVWDKRRRV